MDKNQLKIQQRNSLIIACTLIFLHLLHFASNDITFNEERQGHLVSFYYFSFYSNLFRLLGKVEVPLGELLGTNEIERTYDLVDGKNNPTLVSQKRKNLLR